MKLAVTICATKSYAYAMKSQARLVAANLSDFDTENNEGHIILSTDGSKELVEIRKYYEAIMPANWQVHFLEDKGLKEHQNYKMMAQMAIAQMRTMAFTFARKIGADICWSLDSDVLPPANAYKCMKHMLSFDDEYYSVSTCSYPNDSFLGGRGTETNPISEDFLPHERQLSEKLKGLFDSLKKEKEKTPETRKKIESLMRIENKLMRWSKEYPPAGNVFELNAKQWRKRGWLEHAYPAIGKGAVLPTDWCGFGCTLLSKKALAHANFEGYSGQGTEDLWIIWKRWFPQNFKINVITHVVCDHVIKMDKRKIPENLSNNGEIPKYIHIRSFHENGGDYEGHLRTEKIAWLYD